MVYIPTPCPDATRVPARRLLCAGPTLQEAGEGAWPPGMASWCSLNDPVPWGDALPLASPVKVRFVIGTCSAQSHVVTAAPTKLEGATLSPGAGVQATEPLTGGRALGTLQSLLRGDCPLQKKGWRFSQIPLSSSLGICFLEAVFSFSGQH